MQTRLHIALFIFTVGLLSGCTLGFKSWPSPAEAEDTFSWRAVTAQMAGDSLVIEGRLKGAFENFKCVRLLVEPLGADACSGCPFNPSIAREYRPGDADFELVGPWMKIQLGGLDTTIPYRLQLIGLNRFEGLGDVASPTKRIMP